MIRSSLWVTSSATSRPRVMAYALGAAFVAAGCGGAESVPESAPPVEAPAPAPASDMSVRIMQPTDGASVATPVHIVLEVEGLEIVPAGEGVDNPRAGHHHLLIDEAVPDAGVPIPSVQGHVHMGQGQTEIDLELPPGEHTIIAVIGDFAHRPFSPSIEDTIQIVVH
jgi:hypothetical protein